MSFFFALVFMILVFWRPQEWLVPELYGSRMLVAVIVLSCFAFFVEFNARRIEVPKGPVIFLFVGLLVGAMMSQIAHMYLTGLVETFHNVWKMCFFSILLYCVTDRPGRLRAAATVFVVMTCIMVVHALMQQFLGHGFVHQYPVLQVDPESGEQTVRSLFFGIFEDPNDLAQILATAIPFAFVLTKRPNAFSTSLGAGVAVLLVAGIIATHSRGGLIALAAVGAVLAILLLPKRWMMAVLLVMAIGALALCPFAGAFLDDSSRNRIAFWGEANWVFKQGPLFGAGYGMISDYITDDRAIHNAFVLCYSELGLFGYWFWFTILVTGIVGSWRARVALASSNSVEAKYVSRFAGMAIAATAGFLVSSYFLSRAYVYPLFFLAVLLNAVPSIASPLLPDRSRPLTLVVRDLLVYGTLGTVGSIGYIYMSILLLNRAAAQV